MIDLIKKAALTGIGAAALTSEKIEEMSKEWVGKSKMSEEEGKKFLAEMLIKAEESKEALKQQTESMVNSALARIQVAKAEDIDSLKQEIASLRVEIQSLKEKDEDPES
jgi:polyhydroxyalkanoate synthesis regulator phasin